MSKIKCLVEECHYYANDLCEASEIEVRSCCNSKNVKTSSDTECKTFVQRGDSGQHMS